ncbi:hypothetical protein ACFZB9_15815 [Kitasatospora sp. NPDC008050]|uniref:hypothetical protein n=1 Tax=Kitasatospora sp. NPDC008050 TaxID=3364021 RepID=UPI0036E274AC
MATIEQFIAVSAELTGFSGEELRATGMAEAYWAVVLEQAGAAALGRLVAEPLGEGEVRELARAVVGLWYLGSWASEDGPPVVVSSAAYAQGLVWRAFGGQAPGVAAQGFGSWAAAPLGVR